MPENNRTTPRESVFLLSSCESARFLLGVKAKLNDWNGRRIIKLVSLQRTYKELLVDQWSICEAVKITGIKQSVLVENIICPVNGTTREIAFSRGNISFGASRSLVQNVFFLIWNYVCREEWLFQKHRLWIYGLKQIRYKFYYDF